MNTNPDVDESEASFGEDHTNFLDGLGMKMDDTLHSIFTA